MNTKHTPGPLTSSEGKESFVVLHPDKGVVARIKFDPSNLKTIIHPYEQAKADAKLYAASPELLDNEKTNLSTVASLIHGIKSGTMDNDFILQTLYNMKRDTEAAIKKATE